MENVLADINNVVGVWGSMACNSDGEILSGAIPDEFRGYNLPEIARTIAQTMNGLALVAGKHAIGLDLHYAGGRIVSRNVRGGCLTVLCEREVNLPLLNMALDGATKEVRGQLESMKPSSRRLETTLQAQLITAIEQVLGEHAERVTSVIEAAGSSHDSLINAVKKVEGMTRLFIDSKRAEGLARRMNEILSQGRS